MERGAAGRRCVETGRGLPMRKGKCGWSMVGAEPGQRAGTGLGGDKVQMQFLISKVQFIKTSKHMESNSQSNTISTCHGSENTIPLTPIPLQHPIGAIATTTSKYTCADSVDDVNHSHTHTHGLRSIHGHQNRPLVLFCCDANEHSSSVGTYVKFTITLLSNWQELFNHHNRSVA